MTTTENLMQSKPDISISVNQAFGFDTDLHVEGFSKKSEYVPEIDSNYCFDKATTMAILSGLNITEELWSKDYMELGNQHTLNRLLLGLIGLA